MFEQPPGVMNDRIGIRDRVGEPYARIRVLLDILKAERIRVQNNTDGVRHRTFATQGSSAFLGMERDCAQQIVFVADQMTEAAAP